MLNKETQEIFNTLCEDLPKDFNKTPANPAFVFLSKLSIKIRKLIIDVEFKNRRHDIRFAVDSDLDKIGRFCFGTARRSGENDFNYRNRCLDILKVNSLSSSDYYKRLAIDFDGVKDCFVSFDDSSKKIKISYISEKEINSGLKKHFSKHSLIGDQFTFIKMEPVLYSVNISILNSSISSQEKEQLVNDIKNYCLGSFDIDVGKIQGVIYQIISLSANAAVNLVSYQNRTDGIYPKFKGVSITYD